MGTLSLDLPERSKKPREKGVSNLVDNGYGLRHLEDVLSCCHPFVDIVKMGWGSAYISSNLKEKVALFKTYDIKTCLGGMMTSSAAFSPLRISSPRCGGQSITQ